MKKFEYMVLDVPPRGFWNQEIDNQELVEKLNELGIEGWEIASSFTTNRYEGQTRTAFMILKHDISA